MPRAMVVANAVTGVWLATYVTTLLLRNHGQF